MTRLVALEIGGETTPWTSIGLQVVDGASRIADVELRFTHGSPGISGWVFSAGTFHGEPVRSSVSTEVNGIPTTIIPADGPSVSGPSPFGPTVAVGLDHVVVNTADPEAFRSAIADVLGLELRRVRPIGNGREQWFYKPENTVIEVVTSPDMPAGPARLWGAVASVEDVDVLASTLGDGLVSTPKQAVQPGRRIATVREAAGLGLPFALMTPHQR